MEKGLIIIAIGALVFLSHLFTSFFKRTRIPDVLFLILIGLFLGPITDLITPTDFGKTGQIFITIALVVILFDGGLELGFETLKKSLKNSLLVTFVSYLITLILLTVVLAVTTNFSFTDALYIGAVLAGPAPAIVIPLVRQIELGKNTRTKLTIESALGESLCIVISLAVLEAYKVESIQIGHIFGQLIASFSFAVIIGGLGGLVWSIFLHKIRELQLAILTTPAFVFIIYGVADFLGYSGPVAALAFGIIMGNASIINIPALKRYTVLSPIRHNEVEIQFFREMVFLLKTFFFVYLGISIQFSDVISIFYAILLTIMLLAGRVVSVLASVDRQSTTRRDARIMAVLIPKGTAAAVLGSVLFQSGIPRGSEVQNLIFIVVLLSVIVTAVLLFLLEKTNLGVRFESILKNFRDDQNRSNNQTGNTIRPI